MIPRRMTEWAHQLVRPHLHTGDVVVDATCGNGHDTLFLADAVGPTGKVYAFDVQEEALHATKERLQHAQCDGWVQLVQTGHEHLLEHLQAEHYGQVRAVMFNLGYLPGGDKSNTTEASSTLAALDQALDLLAPDGLLSLVVYPGHEAGKQEAEAIQERLNHLENRDILECRHSNRSDKSPYLLVIH